MRTPRGAHEPHAVTGAAAQADRKDRLGDLRHRAEGRPFVRNWTRRRAQVLLGVLDASMALAIVLRPGQEYGPLLVACAAFGLLTAMEALRPVLGTREIVWSCAALLVLAVVVAPRDSDDVWSYAMYGHMVVRYHANPYSVAPLAYSGDPWFWRVSVWWQDTRTVYGPVFTAVSAMGMGLAGDSALRARLFFQVLTAGAILGSVLLLRRRGAEAGALVFLGLSPLMVVNVANGAHNDALVGLALLAGVVIVSRRRADSRHWVTAAGVLLGIGALVKLIALLPAAALAFWLWRAEGRRRAVVFVATVGALVVAGYVLAGGPGALAPVQEASRLVNHWTLWGWLGHKAPASPTGEGPLGGLLISPVPKLWLTGAARYAVAALVAAVAGLATLAWARDERPSAGAAATVLAFVLATSYVQPWYLAAILPVLALQWRSRLAALGAAYSLLVLLADGWDNATGVLKTLFRIPFSTVFPVFGGLALAGLVVLAVQRLRTPPLPAEPALRAEPLTTTAA